MSWIDHQFEGNGGAIRRFLDAHADTPVDSETGI